LGSLGVLCLVSLLLAACQPVVPQASTLAATPTVTTATLVPSTASKVPLKDAIANMEPKDVWQNFYEVTQIPRPSGHDEQIRAFLVQFGQDLGLETSVDEVGNVLIRKPAAPGMENRIGVVLQAHMDMVPQADPGVVHDFTTDPIQAYVEGEWVKAEGTTLGADDGIGIAVALAVLQSQTLAAGPIEALFTVDEETSMAGANGLLPGVLEGRTYINLDSEEEGTFTIGSAGGVNVDVEFAYAETAVPPGMAAYTLTVRGLKGGHSGVDINLGRGHAVKLLVRFLRSAPTYGLRLAGLEGGTATNAIPREASALVCIPVSQTDAFLKAVEEYQSVVQLELAAVEPDLHVLAVPAVLPAMVMDETVQRTLVDALDATPQGVMRMSDAVPGLVETSTNMGIVQSLAGEADVACYLRSSIGSSLDDLAGMMSSVWDLAGVEVIISGRYDGWAPNADSPILALMQEVYENMYGEPAEVMAVHAGLECGTVVAKYPGMDAISIGATSLNIHSPTEALNIASVKKLTDFLFEVLQRVPEK
jgi:dipeptidase D